MKTKHTVDINNIHLNGNSPNHLDGTPVNTPQNAASPRSAPPADRATSGAAAAPKPKVPGFMNKPRADSPLWRLPDDIQSALIDFIEVRTLGEAVKFMAEQGVKTSRSALGRFRAAYLMLQDRSEDEGALEMMACEPGEHRADVSADELFELGQRRLMARAVRLGDDRAWARLHGLRLQQERMRLLERKVRALEELAAAGRSPQDGERSAGTLKMKVGTDLPKSDENAPYSRIVPLIPTELATPETNREVARDQSSPGAGAADGNPGKSNQIKPLNGESQLCQPGLNGEKAPYSRIVPLIPTDKMAENGRNCAG
jgi:hypothetical protein